MSCGEAVAGVLRDSDEARLFAVELSKGCALWPVDWRRFAYDHDEVGRLIARCVQDYLSDVEPSLVGL
jgi:hypothetical protein